MWELPGRTSLWMDDPSLSLAAPPTLISRHVQGQQAAATLAKSHEKERTSGGPEGSSATPDLRGSLEQALEDCVAASPQQQQQQQLRRALLTALNVLDLPVRVSGLASSA